jgi:hypothetical protein
MRLAGVFLSAQYVRLGPYRPTCTAVRKNIGMVPFCCVHSCTVGILTGSRGPVMIFGNLLDATASPGILSCIANIDDGK